MDKPEQKELLRVLVTRLYKECGMEIEPLPPKVLVRVLPKEQQTRGGIHLPDGAKQSKPVYEGIVLKTYKPFFQKVYIEDINWRKDDWDKKATYRQLVKCELQPGDHVLFPHIEYGITPVWPLDDGVGDYRLVPESVIHAKLEYSRENKIEWLTGIFEDAESHEPEKMADVVMKKADVIRKDLVSLTLSGE